MRPFASSPSARGPAIVFACVLPTAAQLAAAWSAWLLANPAWLGTPIWSIGLPWGGFAVLWMVVQLGMLRSVTRRSVWLPTTVVVPLVLFAAVLAAYSTNALIVARVYLSQDSLSRLASDGVGYQTTRAGFFKVWQVDRSTSDDEVILHVKGGVFNEGVLVRSPTGRPAASPEYESVTHLYGPWWAMVESEPVP